MEIQSAESAFRAVWVAPSIILSLGITRLCSDMILWVRSYRHFSLDWIPLTWSACIFIWQIQYLWAIIELPSLIRSWTLPEFLALLLLSLTIFFASALVVPQQEKDIQGIHEEHTIWRGCGALIAVSTWGLVAVLVDVWMFKEPLFALGTILMFGVGVMPLLFLLTKNRWKRGAITIVNFVLTLCAAWIQSPKSY